MKAFVTGATGFLGSHLVDALLREGVDVSCLVRSSSNLRWLKNKKVSLIEGDLHLNDAGLKKGLAEAEWVFHLAGLISTPHREEYFKVNSEGTRHCLDLCLKHAPQIKRFVLVSSIAAGGPSAHKIHLQEQMTPKPISDYGLSKLEGERLAMQYKNKIPLTILRPSAIYGPRDTMILPVFKMAKNKYFLLPSGEPRWISMIYVEDAVRACLWSAQSEKALGEIFYIAEDAIYQWGNVADALSEIYQKPVRKIGVPQPLLWTVAMLEESRAKMLRQTPRINRGHVTQFFRSWGIDISKIKNAGFTPKFDLKAGMQASVEGYRQLGWI